MAVAAGGQINIDTAYMKNVAKEIKATADLLRNAARCADKARKHTAWKCSEKSRVTENVDSIKRNAERNASLLDAFAGIIEQGESSFNTTQRQITSKLGKAEYKYRK